MEDEEIDHNLSGSAEGIESDDDLFGGGLAKICSQSSRRGIDKLKGMKAESSAILMELMGVVKPESPRPKRGEENTAAGHAESGTQKRKAGEGVGVEDAQSQAGGSGEAGSGGAKAPENDDLLEPYDCPTVAKLSELQWTMFDGDWRPCKLCTAGELITRNIEPAEKGFAYVDLFPLRSDTHACNTIKVKVDKLCPFNHEVEDDAPTWSPVLKAKMLRTDPPKKKRKSAPMNKPKTKTSVPELTAAMDYAEESLQKSLRLIEEKAAARRRAEEEEAEALAAMEASRPMEKDKQPEEEKKEEGGGEAEEDQAGTAAGEKSRFRIRGNVTLRPGDVIKYKRDGAHMTGFAESIIIAVKPNNAKSKDPITARCLVQVDDQSWLGPDDMLWKIKKARSGGLHEDVPVKDWRQQKVSQHHLVAAPLQGWKMDKVETRQQAIQKIVADATDKVEDLFQKHFCNRKKRKKSKAVQEEEKEVAVGGCSSGAEEAAPTEGRAETPPGEPSEGRTETPPGEQNTD